MNLNSILLIIVISLFSYGQYIQTQADNAMISQLTNINKKLDDCNFKLNNLISNNDTNTPETTIVIDENGFNFEKGDL